MTRLGVLAAAISGGLIVVGCSDSPVAPKVPEGAARVIATGQPAPGTYSLHFLDPVSRLEVTSEPFGSAVILQALVSGGGAAATGGAATFQYCSRKGFPPNDINRIDEAPLEVCADGDGTWDNLATVPVANGIAELTFCCPQVTPTIGFRYRYLGQGSGIANRTITPLNFNWQ